MKRILSIMMGVLFFFPLSAQNYEVGAFLGLSYYEGELAPKDIFDYYKTLKPAAGIFGRIHLHRNIAFRFGYNRINIAGGGYGGYASDKLGLNVETAINELNLLGELTIYLPFFQGRTALYGFGGGAVFTFNPIGEQNGRRMELQKLGTEAQGQPGYGDPYDLYNYSLIAGGGLKLFLSDRWILAAEYGLRKTFTDYLDDISPQRIIYGDLLKNGQVAAEFSYPNLDPDSVNLDFSFPRGGPSPDWYFSGGLTLSYFFSQNNRKAGKKRGKKIKCYQF